MKAQEKIPKDVLAQLPAAQPDWRSHNIMAIWQAGMAVLQDQVYQSLRPPLHEPHAFHQDTTLCRQTNGSIQDMPARLALLFGNNMGVYVHLFDNNFPDMCYIAEIEVDTFHSTNIKHPAINLHVEADYNSNGLGTGLALLAEALCQLYVDYIAFRSRSVTFQVIDAAHVPCQSSSPNDKRFQWTSWLVSQGTGWQRRQRCVHGGDRTLSVYLKKFRPQTWR